MCNELIEKLKWAQTEKLNILSGFDGFVDEIIHVVDKRIDKDNYIRVKTIEDYGHKILNAAGVSSNIENVVVQRKMGGNGPIFANGLHCLGVDVTYLGAVGTHSFEDVFSDFSKKVKLIGIAEPAHTDAIEFNDGKLICSKLSSFNGLTWDKLVEKVGVSGFAKLIDDAHILSFNNWTMILSMNDIWAHIIQDILPLTQKDLSEKIIFFDLADPQKRSKDDLAKAVKLILEFRKIGLNVVLGLNYREALQIGDIVLGRVLSQNETIEKLTRDLGEMLNINCLLVHRHKEAACFTNNTYYEMSVPYCNTPKLTTGAGDNFNSGFVYAYANQMTPDECLKCAIGTSGYYVRNGHSPTINELVSFFVEWDSGELA